MIDNAWSEGADAMTDSWRIYHQRWTPVAVRAVYPVCIVAAAFCIVGYVRVNNPTLPVALVLVVAFLAIIAWGERRGVKQGLYESETGLTCVHWFGSYVLPWPEVVEFDHRRAATWDRVYAKRTDGRLRLLASVLQGQRVVWEGGETRDIVGVLNERVAEWRRSHEPRGMPPVDTCAR
jgi:hypothetical protein